MNTNITTLPRLVALSKPYDDRVITKNGLITSIFISGLSIVFQNGIYFFCCFTTIALIIHQLWRFGKPGILVFIFLFQWIQVVCYIIWMNVNNRDINFLSKSAGTAIIESCGGLLLMALIFNHFVQKIPIITFDLIKEEASRWNPQKILIYYLISTVFFSSIGFALGNVSGFTQILVTLALFKWIFFIIYGYLVFTGKGSKLILAGMVCFEFFSGLYSYFSSFKEVIFFFIIVSLSFIRRITLKQIILALMAAIVLLFILLTWTIIKGEYRAYLNQGKKQQLVIVSKSDALSKMNEQLSNLSWEKYNSASNLFLYRAQYILHLAKTMDRVPSVLPHEYGGLWMSNVSYVITPRILNPNKPVLQATVKTNKYTGIKYAGFKQGASFSLGYFADSYVDFGHILMYIPLAIIAYILSSIYLFFIRMKKLNLIFRIAIIDVLLSNFMAFEVDGTFLTGRMLVTFLTLFVFAKFVFPILQRIAYKKT